jgi:hypothetical protein
MCRLSGYDETGRPDDLSAADFINPPEALLAEPLPRSIRELDRHDDL